ncbi:MAG: GyrI-like domain-containing protein [Hyphomicrobium sp.]|nr:GyrI-like domain-containing protein [Hyphomicrobium sp.]
MSDQSNISIIFIAPCQLAFARMSGPYPVSSAAAWGVMLDWLEKRSHEAIGHVGFGMALDDPRTTRHDDLRYDACVRTPTTWSAIDTKYVQLKQFEGGAYAKTRHVGSYGALGRVVSQARDILVPRQGLIHDMSRPIVTMNYSYPAETPPSEQISDVCIPVIPAWHLTPGDSNSAAAATGHQRSLA